MEEKKINEAELEYEQMVKTIKLGKIFGSLFEIAGFEAALLTRIPNEYCSKGYCCEDWFSVKTESGTIKIGWRKRVVTIDWSATGKDLLVFFSDNVTKADFFIHAYGYPKVLQYLTTLQDLLSKREDVLEKLRERRLGKGI